MDYRKIIIDCVEEFVFDKRKTGLELTNEEYFGFCEIFNPDLIEIMPKVLIMKHVKDSLGGISLCDFQKNKLKALVEKIKILIQNSSDIKLYEIAFTLSESCDSNYFKNALEFLKNKLIETIPKIGLSEIKKSLISSIKIFTKYHDIASKSGNSFGGRYNNSISQENISLLVNTADNHKILKLLKDFDYVKFNWTKDKNKIQIRTSISAFVPILEKIIQNQSGSVKEIQKEFNALTLEINQKKLEEAVRVLQENNKFLKTQNQLLLKQQELADKIINQ